ncbi:MAG TPA: hypothetical protein VM165_15725 [Planctomycetaceae bacterium]|nr:hypothetical protein [Planctomycetaceae bacterium]
MPLPMMTLREAAAELGVPEAELRVMIESKKIRASMRKGSLCIAPDELAKIRRLRKTTYDSAYSQRAPKPVVTPKTTAPPKTIPPRPSMGSATAAAPKAAPPKPATPRPVTPKPGGLKLPEPPK